MVGGVPEVPQTPRVWIVHDTRCLLRLEEPTPIPERNGMRSAESKGVALGRLQLTPPWQRARPLASTHRVEVWMRSARSRKWHRSLRHILIAKEGR